MFGAISFVCVCILAGITSLPILLPQAYNLKIVQDKRGRNKKIKRTSLPVKNDAKEEVEVVNKEQKQKIALVCSVCAYESGMNIEDVMSMVMPDMKQLVKMPTIEELYTAITDIIQSKKGKAKSLENNKDNSESDGKNDDFWLQEDPSFIDSVNQTKK